MDLLQEITENRFTLVLMNENQYEQRLVEIVKKAEKSSSKICYVCLSKPYKYVIEYLKKLDMNIEKFFFIDVLSSHYKQQSNVENCIFIADPTKLLHIQAAIKKAVTEKGCDHLIFDTISSLLMYEQSNDIIKFTNDLTMERKHQEINKVFIVLKEQSILQEHNANFIKDVGMFMDKVIDVSESGDQRKTEA